MPLPYLDYYHNWIERAHDWLEMIEKQRKWIAQCKEYGWDTKAREETLQVMLDGYNYAINHAEGWLVVVR